MSEWTHACNVSNIMKVIPTLSLPVEKLIDLYEQVCNVNFGCTFLFCEQRIVSNFFLDNSGACRIKRN